MMKLSNTVQGFSHWPSQPMCSQMRWNDGTSVGIGWFHQKSRYIQQISNRYQDWTYEIACYNQGFQCFRHVQDSFGQVTEFGWLHVSYLFGTSQNPCSRSLILEFVLEDGNLEPKTPNELAVMPDLWLDGETFPFTFPRNLRSRGEAIWLWLQVLCYALLSVFPVCAVNSHARKGLSKITTNKDTMVIEAKCC